MFTSGSVGVRTCLFVDHLPHKCFYSHVRFSWLQNYYNSEIFPIYSMYMHLCIYFYIHTQTSIYLPIYISIYMHKSYIYIYINVYIDHNFPTIIHSIVPQHFCYSFSGTTYFQSHCYTQSNRRMDVDMST